MLKANYVAIGQLCHILLLQWQTPLSPCSEVSNTAKDSTLVLVLHTAISNLDLKFSELLSAMIGANPYNSWMNKQGLKCKENSGTGDTFLMANSCLQF